MKPLDTKAKILEAARQLFAQQGFDGTSVKQICDEAGVNISLVSYYFGGKEQVLSELLQTYFFDTDLFKNNKLIDDPLLGIKQIVTEIITLRFKNPEIMTILHREILNQTARNNQIESHIYPVWANLRQYLETGLKTGIFNFKSIDHTFQLVISAIVFPRLNPEFLKPLLDSDKSVPEEIINDTMDFILKGLGYSKQ